MDMGRNLYAFGNSKTTGKTDKKFFGINPTSPKV